jgi:hypothetical protein
MCGSARRFSGSGISRSPDGPMRALTPSSGLRPSGRPDIDARMRTQSPQQAQQILGAESHAAGRAGAIGPSHVYEHGAAPTGDTRTGIVGNLDHQVVEVVVTPKAVARFIGRPSERTVVAAIDGILAPCQGRIDATYRHQGPGPRQAIGAPPQANQTKPSARRCAVALPLIGRNARPSEHNRNDVAATQPHATAPSGPHRTQANQRKALSLHCLTVCARDPIGDSSRAQVLLALLAPNVLLRPTILVTGLY